MIAWAPNEGNISLFHDNWVGFGTLANNSHINCDNDMHLADLVSDTDQRATAIWAQLPQEFLEKLDLLHLNSQPDKPLFTISSNAKFYLSAAYHHVRSQVTTSSIYSNFLKNLWHKSIPKRIAFCVWRAIFNIFPLDESIQKKGISLTSMCLCGKEGENRDHLFISCSVATVDWRKLSVFCFSGLHPRSLEGLLLQWDYLLTSAARGSTMFAYFALTVYFIWKARNKAIHDNNVFNAGHILKQISNQMQLLISSRCFLLSRPDVARPPCVNRNEGKLLANSLRKISWIPPTCDVLKVNIDAAYSPSNKRMAVVIRNHVGGFVSAFSRPIDANSSLHAELLVVLFSIEFAICNYPNDL